MIAYDYKCPKCGHIEEIYHNIAEEIRPACSNCIQTDDDVVIMERIISVSSFKLKGSCWAKDGYASQPKIK